MRRVLPTLLLVSCQVGHTDVQLGFHVTNGASGAAGAAGSRSLDDTCTLSSRQGSVTYAAGEAAELQGTVQLVAVRTNQCARATDCSLEPADVEQLSCDDSRCELWHTQLMEGPWFVLTNLQNGGCLDVGNGSTIDGATIQAFPCHARPNQLWQAVCAGHEEFRLIGRHSGLLLGVHNTQQGGLVQQWSDSATDPDLWRIEQQPSAYAELVATSEQVGQSFGHVEQDPGDGWQQPAFDDAAWPQGLAPFGNRYEVPWTPRTDWNAPELWLRRRFTLDSVPESLDLRLFYNGAVEVFVNGALAYQGSMSIGYRVTPASEAALASLVVGENTVAVHVTRNPDGSFGPFFDLGMGQLRWR